MSLIEDLFNNGTPRGCAPMNDEQAEKSYPLLFEMMNQRDYKDGTIRTPPTIVIRRVPGALEVVLQDHDFCVQKVATTRSFSQVWKAIEKALGDPEAPWKPYKSKLDSELRRKEAKKKG